MNPLKWVLPPWLRIALAVAPLVAIGLLAGALLITRATLHDARQDAKLLAEHQRAELATQQAKWATDGRLAAETYADRLDAKQPIILRSIDKVQTYAQTPEGRAPCLALDRVQSILADRAALFAATAPKAGDRAVSAGSDPATSADQR